MLIDGRWTAAEGGQTWGHRHPALVHRDVADEFLSMAETSLP